MSVDFFETAFFRALRSKFAPVYNQAVSHGEATVILVPISSDGGSSASRGVSHEHKSTGQEPDPNLDVIETHVLTELKNCPGQYLNLRGQAVRLDERQGCVYGVFGWDAASYGGGGGGGDMGMGGMFGGGLGEGESGPLLARILAEESMFDQDKSFRVVVIQGQLGEGMARIISNHM